MAGISGSGVSALPLSYSNSHCWWDSNPQPMEVTRAFSTPQAFLTAITLCDSGAGLRLDTPAVSARKCTPIHQVANSRQNPRQKSASTDRGFAPHLAALPRSSRELHHPRKISRDLSYSNEMTYVAYRGIRVNEQTASPSHPKCFTGSDCLSGDTHCSPRSVRTAKKSAVCN